MKLHRLKIFATIAKHLNVTAAAEELYLSQPAASLHLKLLEQEYDLLLFKRKNSGMELTDEGRDFLETVTPILAGMEALDARFKDRNRPRTKPTKELTRVPAKPDVVLVGSNHTLVENLFSNVLVRFRERWRPDAQLVLEVAGSNSIESLVDDSRLDVALISNPRQLPNCEYEPFQETKYEVAVIAGAHTPLSKYSTMSLEELQQQPLVVRTGSTCLAELRRRGHEFGSVLQCRTPEAAKLAITQGMGIGLLLRSWVQAEIDRGEMIAITVPEIRAMTYQCYITWNKRRALNGHAQHLIQTMREMRAKRLCA